MKWKFWRRPKPAEGESFRLNPPLADALSKPQEKAESVSEEEQGLGDWGPRADKLGVESLYLPFPVSPGWADADLTNRYTAVSVPERAPLSYLSRYPEGTSSLFGFAGPVRETLDEDKLPPNERCNAPLYTLDGKSDRRSLWCWLPKKHKGKHGAPGVEYLHPHQHPLWVHVTRESGTDVVSWRDGDEEQINHDLW